MHANNDDGASCVFFNFERFGLGSAGLAMCVALGLCLGGCGDDTASKGAEFVPQQMTHKGSAMTRARSVDGHSAVQLMQAIRPQSEANVDEPPLLCTAVRIRPDVVLTTESCVTDALEQGYTHFVTSSGASPLSAHTGQRYSVIDRFVVPQGSSTVRALLGPRHNAMHNLALGFLSEPDLDNEVFTLVAHDEMFRWPYPNDLMTVGYGIGDQTWFKNRGAGIKREADIKIHELVESVAIGSSPHATMCMGDFGAPLFAKSKPTLLLGLYTGKEWNFFGYCNGPSYWARTQDFKPWIDAQLDDQCARGLRPAAMCESTQ